MNIEYPKLSADIEKLCDFCLVDISVKFNLTREIKNLNICNNEEYFAVIAVLEEYLEDMRIFYNKNYMFMIREFNKGSAMLIRSVVWTLLNEECSLEKMNALIDNYEFYFEQLKIHKDDIEKSQKYIAELKRIKDAAQNEKIKEKK